ncbi:MAG: hypothetical protein ACUVTZ_02485 [Armatimonadota bacterium]
MRFRRRIVMVVSAVALAALVVQAGAYARPERKLAGITIGSKGLAVLRAYGNPTRVANGLGAPPTGLTAGMPGQEQTQTVVSPYSSPAGPYGPGGMGVPNPYAAGPAGPYGPGGAARDPYLSRFGPPGVSMPGVGAVPNIASGPGALPVPGVEGGEAGGVTGMGTLGTSMDLSIPTEPLVTWTYELKKQKLVLDFRLDEDGRVVEIVATGKTPSSLARTAAGITLGDPYGKVLRLYGPPDAQFQQVVPGLGNVTTVSYQKKHSLAFQLQNLKVVRIVVAEVK